MASLTHKGKLSTWKDDKGFGFIKPEEGKQDVFIHITALKKMSRRPVIEDVILYQTSMDNKGKIRAINARIEGVKPIYSGTKKSIRSKKSGMSFNKFGFRLIMIIIVALFLYNDGHQFVFNIFNEVKDIIMLKNTNSYKDQPKYKCEGKVYCSEMTSCEEAMFYLNNCPGVKIDGDYDGVPCERQWCGH
ncbi:cold shock domain-containing protein [Desulfococcaceae bacterium HSG9]|nr:cold shock domain-containing protein [Desulfococcaceae bacterium HSG9]